MATKEESKARIRSMNAQSPEFNPVTAYKKRSKLYDQDTHNIRYTAPRLAARYLHKHLSALGFSTDAYILDVGAGTGLVTEQVKTYGYSVVDGADASPEMLEQAEKKNLYRNTFCGYIGDGHKLPMIDNTYDAAVMSGCFVEGLIKCDSLLEMIRVVKPGGVIVNVMKEETTRKVKEYTKLRPLCAQWEDQGLWRRLEETVPQDVKYYEDDDALVQVYQVV